MGTSYLEAEQRASSPRQGELRVPGRVCAIEALLVAMSACGPGEGSTDEPGASSTIRAEGVDRSRRITRVVSGLRHEVRFTNRPDPTMSLADRMKHYRVTAVAVAVVDDYRVAWVRVYGSKRSGAEYGWPGFGRDRRTMVPADPASEADLAGRYEWNSGIETTVRYRDRGLEARFGDEGRFRLLMPIGPDEFVT